MSLVATDFPDDGQVVLAEVLLHFVELDGRAILEPVALTDAWMEVHQCDDEVLEALDPAERSTYQAVSNTSRSRSKPSQRWPGEPVMQESVVRLHLALHRRVVVLRDLVPGAGCPLNQRLRASLQDQSCPTEVC